MTDRELLGAWKGGDRDAGEALFARHFDDIFRFFRRKIGGDVADLVQQTFLACLEGVDSFRGDCSVRTYLFAIARNRLFSYFRDKQRDASIDFSVSSLRDLGESPSQQLARRGDNALLAGALELIPLELQLVIELHYWEDLTGPEIARVLDIPEGTVRSRLRRALEQLRTVLSRAESSSATRWPTVDSLAEWARSMRPYESAT